MLEKVKGKEAPLEVFVAASRVRKSPGRVNARFSRR